MKSSENSSTSQPSLAFDEQFAEEVISCLSTYPKKLPSKYFYDEIGDRLFQQIMAMPEYYLTNSEYEIFSTLGNKLLVDIDQNELDLVELGSGDGYKTKLLLRQLLEQGIELKYFPIDISLNILHELQENLHETMPALPVQPINGEYFHSLEQLPAPGTATRLVLFLGSNIGNMELSAAEAFLKHLAELLNPGDLMLIGFDLKKDPQIILDAYNDPHGYTRDFNLNLLTRINRELAADFDLSAFKHWETYDPVTGEARSYLVSNRKQTVTFQALEKVFQFERWEAINTELSLKYSPRDIRDLAEATGFKVVNNYFDNKAYFVDSLWRR